MRKLYNVELKDVSAAGVCVDTVYTITGDTSKTILVSTTLITMSESTCYINMVEVGDVFSIAGYNISDTQSLHGFRSGAGTVYELHDASSA